MSPRAIHRRQGNGLIDSSALDPEIFRRSLSSARHLLIFDSLPIIESREAGTLHRGDMNKDVFAATLRLDEPVALLSIEPFQIRPVYRRSLLAKVRLSARGLDLSGRASANGVTSQFLNCQSAQRFGL
jgi:hypothetical protein